MTDAESLIAAKLDTLIKLQSLIAVEKFESNKEKISFLNKMGLKPKEIGELLGTSANTVSVTLAKIKAVEKRKTAVDSELDAGIAQSAGVPHGPGN